MALKVDILKVEPLGGTDHVLARVTLGDRDQVVIEADEPDYWREMLVRTLGFEPDEDPERFLREISERFDGTYIVASEPHDDEASEDTAAPDLGAAPA